MTIKTFAFAAAFAFCAFTPADAAGPTPSKNAFDGSWSVVIQTEKGTCDQAYRYPIKIADGTLKNGGDAAFDISGKVNPDGSLTVRVSHGDKSANGAGHLAGTSGTGSWTGGACSGVWIAERRG
jgi:hypothetical protein